MTFRDRVYEISKGIQKGSVAAYGQIAILAGKPKGARAVGLFMRTNPYAPTVPCHRVVGADGKLTGFSSGKGLITKKEMLIEEGVKFVGDKVDLSSSQWNKR